MKVGNEIKTINLGFADGLALLGKNFNEAKTRLLEL